MVDLVPDEHPLKAGLREIDELAAYATAYRYPTPAGRIPEPPPGGELAPATMEANPEPGLSRIANRFS